MGAMELVETLKLPVDTLELIQKTAQKAQKARLLPELSMDGRKAFVQHGDQIKEFDIAPPNRMHMVRSLVDLILFARRPENAAPVVWHDASRVTLVVDDADRRDLVCFPLTLSNRFEVLGRLAEKKPVMNQTQFVRLLRVELGLDNLATVAQFRKLDWQHTSEGSGEVQHGNNKMSKSVLAKVQGVADLPDELSIEVPVYQQAGERQVYVVRCAVEIDAVNQQLQLIPLPDEMERAVDLAQANIHERLTAALGAVDGQKGIPVYYGTP